MKSTHCRIGTNAFSLVYFGLAALSLNETASAVHGWPEILLLRSVSCLYALFSAAAFVYLVKPNWMDSRTLTGRKPFNVARRIRWGALLLPLPFILIFGPKSLCNGIAAGAGIAGETLEAVGNYEGAHSCYWTRLQLHKLVDEDRIASDYATMGSICDKLQDHREADFHYQMAEHRAICQHQIPSSAAFGTAKTTPCIALPRLLRLLSQVSDKQAVSEFDFAAWALRHRGKSSLQLGKQFATIDMRPFIYDFRKIPPEPLTLPKPPPDAVEPMVIEGVQTAGKVVNGEKMRRLLRNIPLEKALATFDFASRFYPQSGTAHMREYFPPDPLPGVFLPPTSVRHLVPDQLIIMDEPTYEKLEAMSSEKGHSN